jgi:hypothetical protein
MRVLERPEVVAELPASARRDSRWRRIIREAPSDVWVRVAIAEDKPKQAHTLAQYLRKQYGVEATARGGSVFIRKQ